jgi:valyl-tRNA synthetase
MRLLHPFMPFITEEIWQQLPKGSGAPQSIMITLYPVRDVRFYDDASESSMALVQKVIVALRAIRGEKNIPGPAKVMCLLAVTDDYKKTILEGYKQLIAEQARCSEVRVRRSGASFSGEFSLDNIATALAGDVEVMVPLDGLVDAGAERGKLEKELAKHKKDHEFLTKKHSNPTFIERAPLEVLDKDRARMAELKAAIDKIEAALMRLPPKK